MNHSASVISKAMDIPLAFNSLRNGEALTLYRALTLLFLAPFIIYLIQVLRLYFRLRHIPGPFLNALTPLAYSYHVVKQDVNAYNLSLYKKYGPLVRVTPSVVMISDAKTLRYICSQKAGYRKGLWFDFAKWDLNRPSTVAMRDNEERKDRKGRMTPAFAGPGLALMEQRVDRQIEEFVQLVERKYLSTSGNPRPMDFSHRSLFLALDVVTDATFGEAFGFLKRDGDVERYIEMSEAMLPTFGILGVMPWMVNVMHSWPINRLMPGEGDSVGFGRLMKFASDAVKKHLDSGTHASEHDAISSFLRADIEPEDIVQECITLVVAGTETTALVLRMVLLALLTNPPVYARLRAEIDTYYTSQPPSHIIPYTATKSLPYLQAVIREGMRMWPPPGGSFFTKEIPRGGDTIHGFFLPAGTEIGQNTTGIGREVELWGPDADVFRPERWLDDGVSKGKREEMIMASDIVFSSGKYLCLGKQVALMEIGKFFCEILRRYDIVVHDPLKPAEIWDPMGWRTRNFWIRFSKRGNE